MEKSPRPAERFEPEVYCLRCLSMEWDEETRSCANFNGPRCPLSIRQVLAGLQFTCVVV